MALLKGKLIGVVCALLWLVIDNRYVAFPSLFIYNNSLGIA